MTARLLALALTLLALPGLAQTPEPSPSGSGEPPLAPTETAAPADPAAPPEPAASPKPESVPHISWKNGETILETDGLQIRVQNRVQVRVTNEFPDDTVQIAGTMAPGDMRSSLRISRARTKFEGWLYVKELEYELQLDWADSISLMRDVYLNWDVSGRKLVQLKAGLFKVPFGRQELSSWTTQQFVDRSIVSAEFEKGRDSGIQVWGWLPAGKLEWRAGVFNGNGRARTLAGTSVNDNGKIEYAARLMYQPWGDVKYSEVDFESKDRPLLAIAVNADVNDSRVPPTAGSTPTLKRRTLGTDVAFKYRGVFLLAEVFDRELTPVSGPAYKSTGYHVQGGWSFKRNVFDLAGRWASWDPTDGIVGDRRTELGAAFSWFYKKHAMKAVMDLRRLDDHGRDTRAHELRVQTQFAF